MTWMLHVHVSAGRGAAVERPLGRLLDVLQVHLVMVDPQVRGLDVARTWLPGVTLRVPATKVIIGNFII